MKKGGEAGLGVLPWGHHPYLSGHRYPCDGDRLAEAKSSYEGGGTTLPWRWYRPHVSGDQL